MLQLFPEHIEQMRAEALEAFPHEAAWLITKKGCTQVANIASDPENYFDVSEADVAKARKSGLLAIVHSHTNGKHYPSQMDMSYQVSTAVPWGILVCDGVVSSQIVWWGGKGEEQIDSLENRTFRHGVTDCYALVRDYYQVKLGITLPEYPREWGWWDTDADLLAQGFEAAGFSKVTDSPREHDVWLASFNSPVSKLNHCGILVENDLTFHHPGAAEPVSDTRKAVVTPIYRYLQQISVWVRHKDLA